MPQQIVQNNIYIKQAGLWMSEARPQELTAEMVQYIAQSRVGPSPPCILFSTLAMMEVIPASQWRGKGDISAAFLGRLMSKRDQI